MSEPTRRETHAVAEGQVNTMRAGLYARLMEAQERVAQALYARGVSHADVLAALDAVDERLSEDARREDLYLAALGQYVTALGGRVEVRAVFGEDEILLRQES